MRSLLKSARSAFAVVLVGFVSVSGFSMVADTPLIEPSPYLVPRIVDAFPEDVTAGDSGNDHGWWYFERSPASERDPLELCRAILHEMAAQGEWGWPWVGIEVASFEVNDEGRRSWSSKTAAHCSRPQVLGRKSFYPDPSRLVTEGG
jgi:hypothetical protein